MGLHPFGDLLKRLIRKEPVKRPHPSICKIDPRLGTCSVCEDTALLVFMDRETGENFCQDCLACVESADRVLTARFSRPQPMI